jgi:hypothetical protein
MQDIIYPPSPLQGHLRRKPSPRDVLSAFRSMDPEGYDRVMSRAKNASTYADRRPAMAACKALGWSYAAIGRAFGRDHATVIHAIAQFERNASLGGIPREVALFRALVLQAHAIAARRTETAGRFAA